MKLSIAFYLSHKSKNKQSIWAHSNRWKNESSKRSHFSRKRKSLNQFKNSSIIIIFMSTLKIILNMSVFSLNVATSSIESNLSISLTRKTLKKYFELRYRLDFSNSLNLLIINCMKNVIDFNYVLKSRLYKKIMKNFNEDKWITIIKNENNFLLINKTWFLTNAFKSKRVFRDK